VTKSPYDSRDRVPIGPLLAFVMLTPLVPRPTVGGTMSLIAPIAVALLVAVFIAMVAFVARLEPHDSRIAGRMFFVLLAPTLVYGFRILVQGQGSEELYFAAKVGMSAGSLVILLWLYGSRVTIHQLYKALFAGYCVLALLMIYVGVTGHGIFEPARPPRVYGIRMPFYKAAGVPRSYGELAIFSAAVLAYLLVYRRTIGRHLWLGAMVMWAVTELVAQSRTGFMAGVAVLLAYLALRVFERRSIAVVLVLSAISIPVLAQWLYPSLQNEQFVSDVIGQSTFQNNVDLRLNMYGLALSWLTHPGGGLVLIGISRAHWLASTGAVLGSPVVLHNYFLSTLMFFGLAGGLISLLGLVVVPVWRLARSGLPSKAHEVVFLSTIGMIVSLQFYEGFFSLIIMWQLPALWYVAFRRRGDADDSDSAPADVVTRPVSVGSLASRSGP
jgi:hypothetical protein